MSVPKIVKGQYFDVAVDVTSLGLQGLTGYVIICGLTSRSFTEAYQTNKEYIRDCQDPTMVPFGVINVTGMDFTISGTGLHDRSQANIVRALGGKSLPYYFIEGEPSDDAVDLGYYAGNFVLTNRQQTAADGANVTSQFTWDSDGLVEHKEGAIEGPLTTLTMSPTTATHNTPYTGTITGRQPNSDITATSSDGTELTVTGNTVAGTFAAAGSVQVSLREELAGNDPKTSTITLTVS